MRSRSTLPALLSALLAVACHGDPIDTGPPPSGVLSPAIYPTNLLIISMDTFRRDMLSRYGGQGDTPNLDRILEESFVLENHRSCSNWTLSSMTCVLTGNILNDLGFEPYGTQKIPRDTILLAERLRGKNFYTGVVSANNFFSDRYNLTDGYMQRVEEEGLPADEVRADLVTFYGEITEARWLLHAHFMDPHAIYNPPEEHLVGLVEDLPEINYDLTTNSYHTVVEQFDTYSAEDQAAYLAWMDALYRGEVRFMDAEIGGMLDDLEAAGALESTMVLFLSDHGEQFNDHGELGHGLSLNWEENDALAAFWMPGSIEPTSWTPTTNHADLLPTLYRALKFELPESAHGLPISQTQVPRPIFSQRYDEDRVIQAVEHQGDKLIYDWESGMRFYRRDDDPQEQDDQFDPTDERVLELWGHLEGEVERLLALHPDGLQPQHDL